MTQVKFLSDLKPRNPYSHCKRCGAKIFWVVTESGKNMPVDYDPDIEYLFDGICKPYFDKDRMTSHFITCKFADQFRKQNQKGVNEMHKNNRGQTVLLEGMIILGLIGALVTSATVETAKSGQLKKNGQSIWAHMQGLCTGDNPDARCINN